MTGKPGPVIHAEDLEAMVEDQEREAAAERRAHGIADAELRLRRQRAQELVEALRRPLIEGHPPSDLKEIAALAPLKLERQRGKAR